MANLLDAHAKRLKNNVRRYGRPVTLIAPDETEYPDLMAIWNDVEHGLKMDGFDSEPMGNKSSLYFDRDSLQLEGGWEISPGDGWTAKGSPNAYDTEKTYNLEIPKIDKQLPGLLFWLSEIPVGNPGWTRVGE